MLLAQPLQLPCGVVLKNRFAKSAMSEILADQDHNSTPHLENLYRTWAQGGSGLLISGNVMIDRTALGEPRNVVFDQNSDISRLSQWSKAGSTNQTDFWVQLNHPGKQSPRFLSPSPVAPSAVALGGDLKALFNEPRALTEPQIEDIITRFGKAAKVSKEAGFSGVQIHGAHGYLVSQFLSPRHNLRQDPWGGSLDNRMRFVLEVYRAIRAQVGCGFPVGIKLNSSDFLRDGFSEEESIQVVKALAAEGIDLVEVSGGTYEAPVMMGNQKGREQGQAYFAGFCRKVREQCAVPLMLTGGFRSARSMEQALADGVCDLVGLARPLALEPDLPGRILAGDTDAVSLVQPVTTGLGWLDRMSMLNITWYEAQLGRLGALKAANPKLSPFLSIAGTFWQLGRDGFRKRRA